jgi:adenine-specific DNA-methyltransferase
MRAVATHGDANSPNMLIRGDNLVALSRLNEEGFAGRFRCIYLDPPFNTGRTFREYRDARSPEDWCAMMAPRLSAMRELLAEDGAIFAEIDDTELGSLIGLMDGIFGRPNRLPIVTVVRSATTGHKAINRGPLNVTDYVLVYAKSRRDFRPNALVRPRAGRDPAYGLHLENREAPHAEWRFSPLGKRVARELGFADRAGALKAMGAASFEEELLRFSLANAESVVRFAQPRFEAVSLAARALIEQSRASPEEVLVLDRGSRHKPIILRGGNRLLFLSDKVREDAQARRFIAEPLTNVWDDIPFQGIAREGGVVFSRNKKPERLLERILELSTAEGDWVLDPFLGSGTTCAAAHKMGRHYVGIEQGDTLDTLCIPRLLRVTEGSDATGISRSREFRGGGGFSVYSLGDRKNERCAS